MSTKLIFIALLYNTTMKQIIKNTKYLENSTFVNWVYKPTIESDNYWASYILLYPEEEETINTLKEILLALQTNNDKLSVEDKEIVLGELLTKTVKASKTRNHIFISALKYAAGLALLVSLGTYYVGLERNSDAFEFSIVDIQNMSIDSITETQLITGAKEQIIINDKESSVKYTKEGDVILNRKDTIAHIAKNNIEKEVLNTMIVPYGKRSKLTLSDGTIVHLNSGSRFVFPEKFIGKQRNVFISGEAFFEVSSNKKMPFIVKTFDKDLSIEVVGTKFNVSAYPKDGKIQTVLTEGEVHLNKRKNAFYTTKTKLKPGESGISVFQQKGVEVKTINTNLYTSWIDGVLLFESEKLQNITRKLERLYNVKIDVSDDLLKKQILISGKLDLNDDIRVAIAILSKTTDIKFKELSEKSYEIK